MDPVHRGCRGILARSSGTKSGKPRPTHKERRIATKALGFPYAEKSKESEAATMVP